MKKSFLLSIFIFCFSLPLSVKVLADEADSTKGDLPVYYLGEVMVVGERTQKPPTAISEITAKAIEDRGAITAGEALSSVPGVWVSTGYKNSTEIKLRGFSSKHVLILVDGRPVNLPYYGELDLASLPVSNISKIKVIKGPAASLYGANTMGGIVNIVTKRASRNRTGDLLVSFGDADTWNSALNFGSKIEELDFWFSAGKSKSDGFYLSEDFQPGKWENGSLRENSDYDRFNLDGKLNYKLSPETDISLSLGYFDGEKGLPGGVNEDLPKFWRFVEWERRYFDLAGESYLGTRWYVKAKLYYDGCKNRLIDYDSTYVYENRYFDSIHDSWDLGGSLLWKLFWRDDNQSAWGLNIREDGIDRRMDVDEEWQTHKTTTTSIFTQHQVVPVKRLSLDLGLALNVLTSGGLEKAKNSLDPSVGLWFSVAEQLRLRVSASRATRFPTLRHLYGYDSGNPDLKPEKALKLEAGVEWEINTYLQARADFFRNNVKDLIDRKGRGYIYSNLDRVILQGIETGIRGTLKRRFTFDINYAYLDAYEDNTEYWLPYRPSHKTDFSLSYAFKFGLSLYSSGLLVSRRVTPHPESELMPHYFVTNFKLTQKLLNHFYPFIEIKNLFDENYEEEKGFPMPGRTSLVGLKVTL
jgi:iron complex outermembrane receptor protein